MVTMFGMMEVGARGMSSQQVGLNITGHNIANANTPGYSRQRVNYTTTNPLNATIGAIPTGVQIESIVRLRDEFLDFQIREQTTNYGLLDQNRDAFTQLQIILQDPLNPVADLMEENPAESGLNSLLNRFFNAFQEVSTNPESIAVRATARENAVTLARGFNVIRSTLVDYQDSINLEVKTMVTQINSLLTRIAKLNTDVVRIEVSEGNYANDSRDLRDELLRELSELVPVTAAERESGVVDVNILGVGVVVGDRVSPFLAEIDEYDPDGRYQIINQIERSRVMTDDFRTGRLGSLLETRDEKLPDYIDKLDTIAETLIREVNRIHSGAMGLDPFQSITSSNAVVNANTLFENLDLDFPPQTGSFEIRMVDPDGIVQNVYTVNFDPSVDSLNTLAATIDAIDGVAGPGGGDISAVVNSDNELQITANGANGFAFVGDTSYVLSSLGINTFFSGSDASDIRVSDFIMDEKNGLRNMAMSGNGAEGDNEGALQIAALQHTRVVANNTTTISDYYRQIIAELGVEAQRNQTLANDADSLLTEFENRQQSVSGVSLDEEAVNMVRFQHAFNASARYITIVDELIDRIVSGMGMTR